MQPTKYPKNLEGFILLEKLKENEQEKQKKSKTWMMDAIEPQSFTEKQYDYMEPIPLALADAKTQPSLQSMSGPELSGSDHNTGGSAS